MILLLLSSILTPHDEILVLEPGRSEYPLIYPLVVEGTFKMDSIDAAYEIRDGALYLEAPPAETLIVNARYVSLVDTALAPVGIHEPTTQTRFLSDSVSRRPPVQTREALEVHGSKTFSISVNEKGVSDLDQGLSVDVSGQLSGVDVQACITDEEGTFVSEGTTERIEEFDRIAISLSQDQWKLSMGDLDLAHPLPSYGTIERRLQGATGEVSFNRFKTAGAFGIDGSKQGREVLKTEDGKQGPYFIGSRESNQPVIPGSERVYLDGRLMERGIKKDYVIDYSTGEITFTNYRRIDAMSRLEADYNYSGTDYSSNNELAGFNTGPFEGLFYREADSRTHLFHSWSQEQQAVLDTAKGGEAVLAGGRYVGENKGSYVIEDGHYVWAGPGAGSYEVSFRRVEAGGDYVLDPDSGFFRYIGPDAGDYLAEILTSLPSREEAVFLSLDEDIGALNLSLSGIGSRRTPNLYNESYTLFGHAHRIETGIETEHIQVELDHRLQTPEVWIPSDGDDADAADRWNRDSLPPGFNEQNIGVTVIPVESLTLVAQGGHLWTQEHEFRAGMTSTAPFFDLSANWLKERQRAQANLYPRIGIFIPLAGLGFDNRMDTINTRNIEPMLGIRAHPMNELTLESKASRRIDQRKNTDWEDTLYYDRLGIGGDWGGEKLSLSANTGIERISYLDTLVGGGWQAFYADLYTDYTPSSRIRLYADLSQHTTRSTSEIVEYVPVEPGTGDYSRDPETGEYIPDEHGNYKKTVRTEEGITPEIERSANLGANLSFDLARLWGAVAYQESPASNSLIASGRITLLPRETILNIILEPNYRNQRFPSWGWTDETLEGWGSRVEIRSRVHPDYLVRIEGSYDAENRHRGQQPLRSRKETAVSLSPIIDLGLKIEPEIGFGTLTAEEPLYYPDLGWIVIRRVWAGADLQKRFGELKLTAGALLTQRQPNVANLPYLISRDDPPGLHPSWTAGAERSMGKGLSIRLEYEGNLYPDERGLENEFELSAGMYF
ncbi:hypothetical protein KAX06_01120 [candidate division WOR-3 bacterium]|nr:hypothetical protein [candidate division WOR-3 bacterium]